MFPLIVIYGTRLIKCTCCSRVLPDYFFWTYKYNRGKCIYCENNRG